MPPYAFLYAHIYGQTHTEYLISAKHRVSPVVFSFRQPASQLDDAECPLLYTKTNASLFKEISSV